MKPQISDALVELIDFTATVQDLVGIEPQYDHFGRSLIPLMQGKTQIHRDVVFCEGGRRHGETQCMELSSNINAGGKPSLYSPRLLLQRQEGAEHTKAVMIRTNDFKYVYRLYESDELYDLKTDPRELNNRISDPALKDIFNDLKMRMLNFFVETCDVVPFKTDKR